jgi:hypothetical protein
MTSHYKNGIALAVLLTTALMPSHAFAQISGFNTLNYTLNGGATINNNVLAITDGGGSEARSAFFNTKQVVTGFVAQFTYQEIGGPIHGATFAIQNAGLNAVGAPDNGLGYQGIGSSIAYEMSLSFGGTAVYTNGAVGGNGGYNSNSPVNLSSGHPILVNLQYAAGNLLETLTDNTASTTYTHTFTGLNIPAIVGANQAFVGFTGGTGGFATPQNISNFTFTPTASSTPEPGCTGLLAGLGLSGVVFLKRRRK